MINPIVTIITTTYNFKSYIRETIDSVLSQTFTDWEMIIIDDFSTDNTMDIVKEYVKKDKRIHLINHHKNWGIAKCDMSHNQALKHAHGKYIALLDGDDLWPKDKLEVQVSGFNKPNIVFSYGDCIIINELGQPINLVYYNQNISYLNNQIAGSILHLFANLDFYILPVTVMIKKEALVKIGGFRKDNNFFFFDVPTFLKLSLQGNFHYEKKVMGFYRKQHKSYWFNLTKKTNNMGRSKLQRSYLGFIKKNKKVLLLNNISLNPDIIRKGQNIYIEYKKEHKPLTLLFHYFVFDNSHKLYRETANLLKKKGIGLRIKMMAILFCFINPVKRPLLIIFFKLKFIGYKLRRIC